MQPCLWCYGKSFVARFETHMVSHVVRTGGGDLVIPGSVLIVRQAVCLRGHRYVDSIEQKWADEQGQVQVEGEQA